jgi:hypothetical protein
MVGRGWPSAEGGERRARAAMFGVLLRTVF